MAKKRKYAVGMRVNWNRGYVVWMCHAETCRIRCRDRPQSRAPCGGQAAASDAKQAIYLRAEVWWWSSRKKYLHVVKTSLSHDRRKRSKGVQNREKKCDRRLEKIIITRSLIICSPHPMIKSRRVRWAGSAARVRWQMRTGISLQKLNGRGHLEKGVDGMIILKRS